MMRVTWTASFRASCLHAAHAMALGQVAADVRLAEAIAEPVHALRVALQAAAVPRDALWRHLTGLAVIVDSLRDLAERALTKTVGAGRAGQLTSRLAASLAAVESAMRRAAPELDADLLPRGAALRQAWDERGSELLHAVVRWTDPQVVVSEAQVVLVHPFLGGGGAAHLPYNNVHIEALSAAPLPEPVLPELLRLTWLLAQLNLDVPVLSEHIDGQRLPAVAELAMVPVTLQAAEDAGMARLSLETLDAALQVWHIVTPPDVDPVEILWRWWGTYLEAQPRWHVAFTALDRMLGRPAAP
ncbi:MAG: hypothetical protein MUF48_14300 [Pirellulaceae bacterium]|nr:hypothetical protein [Pirellulaceae bacterium]